MPILWVAGEIVEASGEAAALSSSINLQGALLSVGFVIGDAVAYWFGDSQPVQPYGVALSYCDDGSGKTGGGA